MTAPSVTVHGELPVIPELLQAIRGQYLLPWEGLHGIGHWARVCENGLRIASAARADVTVLLYFSIFHDACRRNEGHDPAHGWRGAELALRLRGRIYEVDDERFEMLRRACAHHTGGRHDGSPTVLACWDADRLDLARAGITPRPERLCTEAARSPEVIEWACGRSRTRTVPSFVSAHWMAAGGGEPAAPTGGSTPRGP
jgi:uncharacterized protein